MDDDTWRLIVADEISESEAIASFNVFLSKRCLILSGAFAGAPDGRTGAERLRSFQTFIGAASDILKAASELPNFVTAGDMELSGDAANKLRLFFDGVGGRLRSAVDNGSVMLSDRDVPPIEGRVTLFARMEQAVDTALKDLQESAPKASDLPDGQVGLDQSGEIGKRLLLFFSNAALHRASQGAIASGEAASPPPEPDAQ